MIELSKNVNLKENRMNALSNLSSTHLIIPKVKMNKLKKTLRLINEKYFPPDE